jgi:AmmeMemoRadiSam system radical SAM enzyme/AmmeMemoRadiSam system protein B/AmmeMemoRadiSam system protein A
MASASEQKWQVLDDGTVVGGWWHPEASGDRIICDLCPRECHLKPGDRGFCFVRENRNGQMVLSTYGRSTGFCIDPIEKKPLNHFYPGTSVLSFGTAGCNLGCKFCQNWDISKSREIERLSDSASPELIAVAAQKLGCQSVAFTYNDPVIWAEYAIDTARACRERNVKTVAVTAGYISPEARKTFYQYMDAANVDLKAFTEEFYYRITYSHLQPVLDTLVYLKKETNVWFEITNLVIPQANDDPSEFKQMCDWILDALGPDVPIHFSAFHPDFRMMDRPGTPKETLERAYEIAKSTGLHYPYIGNVHDSFRQNTYCPHCETLLIERDWYQLGKYALSGNHCGHCGLQIAGCFSSAPGTWGPRRQPVRLKDFAALADNRQVIPISVPEKPSSPSSPPSSSSPSARSSPMSTDATPEITVLEPEQISEETFSNILRAASRMVVASASNRRHSMDMLAELGDLAKERVMGLFITLRRGDQLRGCTGLIGQPVPLADALSNSAYRTCREDTRMPTISPTELPYLRLDVTVLGQPERITGNAEEIKSQIELGKHGLRISRGQQAGLLLPSVPVEQGWTKDEFLDGVCRKAGLPTIAWQDPNIVLERFDGRMVEGHIAKEDLVNEKLQPNSLIRIEELRALQSLVARNILALAQGATPSYYAPGVSDGTANGVVLTLFDAERKVALAHLIRISHRPGMPLQSTLFELCQAATNILVQSHPRREIQLQVELTVMHDPALHGQISQTSDKSWNMENCELEGIDPARRAIVAMMSGSRVAVSHNPQHSPEQIAQEAGEALTAHGRPIVIYSMDYVSTKPGLIATSVPAPTTGAGVRSPAMAGSFYPADDHARQLLVDSYIDPGINAKKVLAIMTPHAGLRYSGRIATHAWQHAKMPSTALIIGPKHTARGVDWAVAPHRRWQLSNKISFDADQDLAKAISERVTGMQLDAAAHQTEHGIEVQLPILERLAPTTKIAAIAMHGGSWIEIEKAAKQLAEVLRECSQMPLLVISSDMNHYAEDQENRRRDRLALNAFKTNDPRKLLDVCLSNDISMCGLLPACLVLQTLRELGKKFVSIETGYGTSADTSHDPTRVVGYAGMMIVEN